eukprot:830316-Rhodomonas_salina.1
MTIPAALSERKAMREEGHRSDGSREWDKTIQPSFLPVVVGRSPESDARQHVVASGGEGGREKDRGRQTREEGRGHRGQWTEEEACRRVEEGEGRGRREQERERLGRRGRNEEGEAGVG